jgi:hypothetical protein
MEPRSTDTPALWRPVHRCCNAGRVTALDEPTDVRNTYLRLRRAQRSLNEQLFREIGKAGMQDCARALGFWGNGIMIFDEEDDVSLLADFAIHEHKEGRAAIEKRMTSAEVSHDERVVLTAMLNSRFTLFGVTEIVPDVGARALDLLSEEPFLLADVNLSETGSRGIIMAAHLLPCETFVMTSGAPLRFDPEIARLLLAGMRVRSISPADLAALPAAARTQLAINLIALARRRPETLRSVLNATESRQGFLPWASPAAMLSQGRAPRVGRNDPCPCGSGKKFKKCCLGAAQTEGG